MKLGQGPAPRRLLPIQEKLIANCEAALKQTDYCGYAQKRLLALRKPDLRMFTGEEIAEVDSVIETFRDNNGTLACEISHRFLGWEAAKYKETIPYSIAFFSDQELTEEEVQHGLDVAIRVSR